MDNTIRICLECGHTEFHNVNGEYVCLECHTFAPDRVETVVNEYEGPGRSSVHKTRLVKDQSSSKKNIKLEKIQAWDVYDGFNFILVKMVDALIQCGADPKIKHCVHKLWAAFMCKIEIAYTGEVVKSLESRKSKELEKEQPSIIPAWFSQNNDMDSHDDQNPTFKHPIRKDTLFAPKKLPKKPAKSKRVNLLDIPDDELSATERRRKLVTIQKDFMKLALSASGAETDVSIAGSIASSSDGESVEECRDTRLSTMKHIVPECFPDTGERLSKFAKKKKTEDYTGPRSTMNDPEYLTLHKLLSFLHAALLMEGQIISYGDITRWVREGFIPLYGAHQLLPKDWLLSGRDAITLGAVAGRCIGASRSRMFRQNTARLLGFLHIDRLPKAPPFVVASKIICDLQLPNELEVHVRTMDRMINGAGETKWKCASFGNRVTSESSYAGALLLVSLKYIYGLDGKTENEISDFTTKVNNLLNLKPLSGFARQQGGFENANPVESSFGIKTLFVWKEWVNFIEYRKKAINSTHVPTAIRRKLVEKMDPDYVLRFAQNEGFYQCHRPKSELSVEDKAFLEIFQMASKRFPSPHETEKRIPTFRPHILGSHGLAVQLLEFDSEKYGLLKQEFAISSLVFSKKPELLASALKKANTPHHLNIHKGPAKKESILTVPFVSSRSGLSKKDKNMDRYAWKIVTHDPEILSVSALSDDEDDNSRPTLVLHEPSSVYWINGNKAKLMSYDEWNLFSAGLPPTFLWVLELICESIEESPKDFYDVFIAVESIIFFQHAKIKRSLCSKEELKLRLVSALRSEF